jgi:hypothetical protein
MKKLMLLAAGLVASVAILAGCSTAQQQQVATVATNVQTQVNKACGFFVPIALDAETLYTLDPKVDLAIDGLNALCDANAAVDASTLQTLAKTTIPAAVKALAAVQGIPPALVKEIGGALTLSNVALNSAVATYAPAVPTVPASAPAAASGASTQ